ncbi:hypothetical protein LOTGIDRAFT_239485, partial [Lottia gigantea]
MADESEKNEKKIIRKLPPLSPKGQALNEDGAKKVVKKKKKKIPVDDTDGSPPQNNESVEEPKQKAPAKPKRRPRSQSRPGNDNEGTEVTEEIHSPSKPKKRKPKKTVDENENAGVGGSKENEEDVTGSKASLIGKESESGTPKKKGKKKKVKKEINKDEFGDAVLASDLTFISEDVVAERVKDETLVDQPHYTSPNILRSQPTGKLYIETNRGFKGEDKAKLAKKIAEEEKTREFDIVEPSSMTTMEFGLQTHKIFKTFGLFLHGLLAGIALWHIVIVYILSQFPTTDFLQHYRPLAMPVQCMYYILLALCSVSACDRCDVANTSGRFFLKALSLQNTAIAIVIYFLALILSICLISTEDKINLYDTKPELWTDAVESDSELSLWRTLNTVRGVSIILGWVVLSVAPNADRLGDNLKKGDDEILGKDVELSGVTAA